MNLPTPITALTPIGEPTHVMYFTFRCTLCEHSAEWRDGYPKTADEVRIAWTDTNGENHIRTMFEEDRCFICKKCMSKVEPNGAIETVDAKGATVIAFLKMYN